MGGDERRHAWRAYACAYIAARGGTWISAEDPYVAEEVSEFADRMLAQEVASFVPPGERAEPSPEP